MKRSPSLLVAVAIGFLLGGAGRATSATARTTTLHVEGMTCADCAPTVKKVALQTAGVVSASVSYEKSTATITFDPAKTTPDSIARAIATTLGYKVTVAAPGKQPAPVAPAGMRKSCPSPPPAAP